MNDRRNPWHFKKPTAAMTYLKRNIRKAASFKKAGLEQNGSADVSGEFTNK